MTVFSYHLAQCQPVATAASIINQPSPAEIPGLLHGETMTTMELGAPVFSPRRLQLTNVALFAAWEDEQALDDFLGGTRLGRRLARGWHVRMDFLRRWGSINELPELPLQSGDNDPDQPVVAVTLARLRHSQIPRFIKWGKPVERLVRDDPDTTIALATLRPMRTVSTFSVWTSQQAMTDMVQGHHDVPQPRRHAEAMIERNRKDFHFEFTTLRFRARSEHGAWRSKHHLIPD